MKRDLVLHHLVALDAQLRRMRGIAETREPAEVKARLAPLLKATCRESQRVLSAAAAEEGWPAPARP